MGLCVCARFGAEVQSGCGLGVAEKLSSAGAGVRHCGALPGTRMRAPETRQPPLEPPPELLQAVAAPSTINAATAACKKRIVSIVPGNGNRRAPPEGRGD